MRDAGAARKNSFNGPIAGTDHLPAPRYHEHNGTFQLPSFSDLRVRFSCRAIPTFSKFQVRAAFDGQDDQHTKTTKQKPKTQSETTRIMKAIQFQFKKPEDISIVDIEKPIPADDEVLIKVEHSALDTAHLPCIEKEMAGYFVHKMSDPLFLGYHYSGKVEQVGSDVKDLTIGTEVFGFLQYVSGQTQGAFAEYITAKPSECAKKPSRITSSVAAASTTEPVTALQAIRDLGGLKKGSSILIVGAAGGVGSAAVQIAKQLGASVTAVCSAKDTDQVAKWGADNVINRSINPDYYNELVKKEEKFSVIFDTADALPAAATRLLEKNGAMAYPTPTMAFIWNKIMSIFNGKKSEFIMCESKKEDLDFVAKMLADGSLQVPIDSSFKVKDMADAMKKQKGRKSGRVVIQVDGGWE